MRLTVSELAHAVGKSENYVRQHINRRHLVIQRDGRNIFVEHDEAARWASERHLPFVLPSNAWPSTTTIHKRVARMSILMLQRPDGQFLNLLTVVRHRRQDELGPWANEPSKVWTNEGLKNGLQLFSLDTTLEHCQELIETILDTGILTINESQICFALEPIPRRRWAFRNQLGHVDAAMISPFSKHSAEIIEYWNSTAAPRRDWLNILDSGHDDALLLLSRSGVPLDLLTDRVGNLIIAGAKDEITCDLDARHDRTLRLHVEADNLVPGDYRTTVWASHAGDEVLRQEVPVIQRLTVIELASDVDSIGFAIFRTSDGQCIDMMETPLIMQVGGEIRVDSGTAIQIQDKSGRFFHEVSPTGPGLKIDVSLKNKEHPNLDNEIRQRWLERRVRNGEVAARREGNLERFGPDEFEDAARYLTSLLHRDMEEKKPIYLADPYFASLLTEKAGNKPDLLKLCLDIFAATAGTSLRILCAEKDYEQFDLPSWWSTLPEQLTAHVEVRSFLKRDGNSRGFHDRFLITPKREIIITHSINGWHKDGVTFARLPYDVYRAEAERLWMMEIGSRNSDLLVREINQ